MYRKPVTYSLIGLLLLPVVLSMGCSSLQDQKSFSKRKIVTGIVTREIRSAESIDRSPTYEIYFKLKESVPCLQIQATSRYLEPGISQNYISLKVYYILEKVVNISKFSKSGKRYEHTPLGKNYTDTWEYIRDKIICENKNEPLQKLDNQSFYRLRFTAFSDMSFEYTITIQSDTEVIPVDESRMPAL